MATLKDVAKAANVSISTASRTLRNIGYISPETKTKILDCAKELGYIADMNAQHLKNGKSKTIGIIVSDIGNYFYNVVISRIESEMKKLGYAILLCYSFENGEMEKESFFTLISAKVSTIIFTPVTDTNGEIIEIAKQNNINIIQLYRKVYPELDALIFDDEYGAYLATEHMLDNNAKRPLLISVKYDNFSKMMAEPHRSKGYIRALEEHGIKDYEILRLPLLNYSDAEIEEKIKQFKPDSVLISTNTFAVSVLKILKNIGLNAPKDIKIVTFDDFEWFSYLDITALRQPTDELAEILLGKLLKSDEGSFFIKLPPQLIIRNSSLDNNI